MEFDDVVRVKKEKMINTDMNCFITKSIHFGFPAASINQRSERIHAETRAVSSTMYPLRLVPQEKRIEQTKKRVSCAFQLCL